jgi:hypothetical protein
LGGGGCYFLITIIIQDLVAKYLRSEISQVKKQVKLSVNVMKAHGGL